MKERQARLEAVKALIKLNPIESQETLLLHLQKEGFDVTQATLSRDLKVLKVGKVSNGHDGYAYTLPDDEDHKETSRTFARDFLRGYISINWSGNMVVIRTHSGHSDSVAMALDSFELQDVLGTISGRDNTVFVVLKEGITGEDFIFSLRRSIPELDEKS
ncbi:MAG: ArgR family transcriptional regulator [Treponema sp.]|nr:ArgR family transcriptional regulator [Treponema sp.]